MSFFDETDEFDELFKHQMQAIRRMFNDLQQSTPPSDSDIENRESVRTQRFGPFVYGRTTYLGPDGKMHTQEWGNLPPQARKELEERMHTQSVPFRFPPTPQERRPSPIPDPLTPDRPFPGPQAQFKLDADDYLIDIFDTADGYTAIFDTPAMSEHDVQVDVNEKQLKLWVQGRIFRELELPIPVTLTSLQFRNGIVELQLRSTKSEEEPKASGESTDQTA
ncbi:MAG: Hsp20/alpha crystallin family protein [Promethearchaeota archaeon]